MNDLQKNNSKPVSIVEKLAMIGEQTPLVQDSAEVSLIVIFKGLVKVYAYLGHRNIFKGDKAQQDAAKLQIKEIAAQILEGFKNNKKYRRITAVDFNSVIEKGCASGLTEIKNVSPKAIFEWVDYFLKMYLQEILKKRAEYQQHQDHSAEGESEMIRKSNLEGVLSLISYCQTPRTSPFADVKQFHGYWLAQICNRYSKELPAEFKEQFSKRGDLYAAAFEKAAKSKQRKETDNEVKAKAKKLYCYKLVEEFKMHIEMEGSEDLQNIMIEAINKHHGNK